MRTTLRTVIVLGCVGFVGLYLLQYSVALAATPFILAVGALAGLVIAKWLPWTLYGHQFATGIRAGILACGLSAAGMLLSLVGTGSHDVAGVASHSRIPGLDLSSTVTSLGTAGWFAPYLLLTAFFALGGVLLAGVVAQVVGWSKSTSTVRVITSAHDAASILHRAQTWAPASNSVPSIGGYWNSVIPSSGPASHPALMAAGARTAGGHASASHSVAPTRTAQDALMEQQPVYLTPLPPLDFAEPASTTPPKAMPSIAPMPAMPEPIPPRRARSSAQPVHVGISDDARHALDRWGKDTGQENAEAATEPVAAPKKAAASKAPAASKPKIPAKRQPAASAYLNSEPPAAPRRNRRKQNTRDWLC